MIYFYIFSIYSILLMGFMLLSYVLWLKRTFKREPVGITVRFKHLGRTWYGRVVWDGQDELLVKCNKGVPYLYVSKELCSPCLFVNLP